MADLSDVESAIAAATEAIIYPQGINAPSILGTVVRIYRGWPNAAALNADLANGVVNLSIFPDPQSHRNTTRLLDPPTPSAPVLPTLTVTVAGQTATFGGTAGIGQIAGLMVDNSAFVHLTQKGDTPENVAATLAAYIRQSRIALANGANVTVPGAGSIIGRVVADQVVLNETRRQVQSLRLSCWCPTPVLRDTTSSLIDQSLSASTFVTLADGSSARLRNIGTRVFDQSQNANLYRRDLLLEVEYATIITQTLPSVVFGISGLLPNGTASKTLLG